MASNFANEGNFSEVMTELLREYGDQVAEALAEACQEVAKESAKKLKTSSPVGSTGKYAKGWTSKVEKERLTVEAVVYGKSGTYQIAHLLEHGHANRGGGRTAGNPHIAPVGEWAVEEVEKRTVQKVEALS